MTAIALASGMWMQSFPSFSTRLNRWPLHSISRLCSVANVSHLMSLTFRRRMWSFISCLSSSCASNRRVGVWMFLDDRSASVPMPPGNGCGSATRSAGEAWCGRRVDQGASWFVVLRAGQMAEEISWRGVDRCVKQFCHASCCCMYGTGIEGCLSHLSRHGQGGVYDLLIFDQLNHSVCTLIYRPV